MEQYKKYVCKKNDLSQVIKETDIIPSDNFFHRLYPRSDGSFADMGIFIPIITGYFPKIILDEKDHHVLIYVKEGVIND